MEPDDLIRQATKGDFDALEALLRHYQSWMRDLVARKASPELLRYADADEIVQRTMTECFRSIENFRIGHSARTSFEAWLATILRHAIYYFARKRRRALLQMASDAIDAVPARSPTPATLERRRERIERLTSAIQQLPELTQKIVAKSLKGMTHQEIADALGMSKTAVNTRLERARRRLRELLGSTSINFSSH